MTLDLAKTEIIGFLENYSFEEAEARLQRIDERMEGEEVIIGVENHIQ